MRFERVHLVFYVRDQQASEAFYRALLGCEPVLSVPGMSEFELGDGCVLGLMPERGIARLLGSALRDPAEANGIPRAELYLVAPQARELQRRAIAAGARELSPFAARDWGHEVAYVADPDGHVLAFALRPSATGC